MQNYSIQTEVGLFIGATEEPFRIYHRTGKWVFEIMTLQYKVKKKLYSNKEKSRFDCIWHCKEKWVFEKMTLQYKVKK